MKRPALTIALVTLIVVAIVIARAPASLIARALADVPDATLTSASGTLWAGSGALNVRGLPLGTVTWDVHPSAMLRGQLQADWALRSAELDLHGLASAGLSSARVQTNGNVSASFFNRQLALYDIQVDSSLTLSDVAAQVDGVWANQPTLTALSGQVRSQAASVRYRLAGRSDNVRLPALLASLEDDNGSARARVTPESSDEELMRLSLAPSGFAGVAITKRFTKLLGRPWPGSDPDHAIVIEVQEQVF